MAGLRNKKGCKTRASNKDCEHTSPDESIGKKKAQQLSNLVAVVDTELFFVSLFFFFLLITLASACQSQHVGRGVSRVSVLEVR